MAGVPGQVAEQVQTLAGMPQTIADALKNFGQTIGLDLTDTQLERYLEAIDKWPKAEDSRRKALLDKQFKVEKREAPEIASRDALAERVSGYVLDGHGKDVEKIDAHNKEVAATATQWAQTDSTETEKENKANRKKPRFVTPHRTWIEA